MLIENPVPWPNGARCAAAITFDLDVDSILHIAKPDTADTFVSTQSLLRYGAAIAIPRICRVYRDLGLRQTFFVPGWCVERYPAAAEAILAGGHELGHHGYLHESPNRLSADDERYWFERALDSYDRILGMRPVGFRAPLNEFSKHSLPLLLEAGIRYDSSLMGDDVPYLIAPPDRDDTILEIPQFIAMDDWPHFMHNWDLEYQMPISAPQRARDAFLAEFDAAWENGGLWMTVWHPFLTGRPSRIKMLIEMVEYMQKKGGVWFATLAEIDAHVRRCLKDGSWTCRTDTVPFDTSPIAELTRQPAPNRAA
jgi:peptidoglycan/xylan/chitin deacetylase (PgdA/CDA1 family)